MNTGTISRRYAKALFELSELSGRGEQDCAQAIELLENPAQSPKVLEKDLQSLTALLIKNGRLPYARFILRSFVSLYRRSRGIVDAQLTLSAPSEEFEEKLRNALSKSFEGAKLDFHTTVDPDIIGGFVLTVDEQMLDGSVRSQLNRVSRALEELNKRIV